MAEHTIITPEVIAIVIGLVLALGGATTTGIITLLRGWIVKTKTLMDVFLDISEDGKFTADEIDRFWKALQKFAEQDPDGAANLVKGIIHKNPALAKSVLNENK